VGPSGTTTTPIAGATTSSYTTPALTTTTSYWVRISNANGTASSATATITVGISPAITTQPQSQTIASGQTATLNVVATGTSPLAYQWYIGASGTTTNAIAGATGSSYTTPSLTSPTSYWVRVSNGYAPAADSATATIALGVSPLITTAPQSQRIASGQTATMSVMATGAPPLTYQWYVGASGVTANPIAGATGSSYTTPALSSTTSYWVRVSNAYPPAANSASATITVGTAPPSSMVANGKSLTVTTANAVATFNGADLVRVRELPDQRELLEQAEQWRARAGRHDRLHRSTASAVELDDQRGAGHRPSAGHDRHKRLGPGVDADGQD
jgi:hypothetical protein